MILSIIFLVLFAGCVGVNIFFLRKLVKSAMIEVDFKAFFLKCGLLVGGAVISFLVASFGFYQWLNATPDAIHIVQLVFGDILFIGGLMTAINCFIVHYYGKNIPEKLDKWLYILLMVGFTVAFFSLFLYTNGLAPYLTYPIANGISFKQGIVTPSTGLPNIAFYALCIISGAILVYFVCDHIFYKEYGKHGLLESTFYVAFPAGIIGARIWYVVGEWGKSFDYGRAMTTIGDVKIWAPLAIWEGGLTILGGAIMGIVVGVLFFLWRNKNLSIWFAVDAIVPTILIAQAVGRWGNFFNCEVHGLVASVDSFKWLPEIIWRNAQYSSAAPNLVDTNELYVPLFFFECMTNLFGYFLIAHFFGKLLGKYHEPGDLCFGYVIWYGLTRVLMEPLRFGEFKMGQDGYWSWVWSMIFVFVGTLLIVVNHIVRLIIKKKNNKYEAKPYDTKLGIISTLAIVVVGGALIAVGAYLMSSNQFVQVVDLNKFNVGIILLVLGASVLITLGISLPILFNAKSKQPEPLGE